MRTARLTAFIATFLLTATAAVAAVGGSVADGAATTGTEVRASATGDTPWAYPSPGPVAVGSFGNTPWPAGGGQ
ncbi:hypothetical protein HYE82_07525 [Streptomyces sp. BR123]|uniref:hypothetical protein n=1 Tax=Streptomyces sp. BR123 TaxID=2749828 RepID=UPI0015C41395|nr:hypothetical protein [Streptomyces sp. BR123]NXY94238.1 hypothetical protein [Streptomyces sp. BR123]